MAECARCKAYTQLFENGVPICLKCTSEREAQRKPPATEQQIRSTLLQDIIELTARVEEATEDFNSAMQIPSGLPHPDGVQKIKNASNRLSIARKELMRAHSRIDEHCSGSGPEDLKQGSGS
jgi:hypothetical protein